MRVVAALVERDGAILAQQRGANERHAGLWEFPGGKVESGESDVQALERECREELGVTVRVGDRAWEAEHAYDDLHVTLVVYHAYLAQDVEPQALDGRALEWIARGRLDERAFCEADRPLIRVLVGAP